MFLSDKFWLFIEYFPMQVRLRRFGWCSTMVPEYFWLQRLETIILSTTLQMFLPFVWCVYLAET